MKRIFKMFLSLLICFSFLSSNFCFVNVFADELEKRTESNTATLFWEQHSSYDDIAEIKRQEILMTKNVVAPTTESGKTTYYISPNGNDSNNGRSPETAWKSTDNLWNYSWFNYGDVILFERDGVYRNAHFVLMNGLSYGAYGEGKKPALFGSAYNYADEDFWEKTSVENIWKLELDDEITNIGNIVFDFGEFCGYYSRENSLTKDFYFWEDSENNCLYLYYSKGNPGKCFEDIEVCDGRNILSAGPNSNIRIDNLCLRYTGAHGMSFGDTGKNVTITNCEVGYIGGSQLVGFPNFVRYGNGIEFYGNSNNSVVDNCWVYQCYDAGLTCQGTNSVISNLTFKNNLVEYCQYDIEIWVGDEELKYSGYSENDNSKLINCVFENNILRFAGYNFQFDNRLGSNTSAAACISAYDFCLPCDENTVIKNNVFDTSYRYLVSIIKPNTSNGPKIINNTWITNSYSSDEANVLGNIPTVACVGQTRNNNDRTYYYAENLSTMQQSVNMFDLSPKSILFDGDKYKNCHVASEWTIETDATCTENGKEIKYCIYCEKVLESKIIPFKGHNEVIDNQVEPTCEKTGLSEGSHCSECGIVFVSQTILPKKPHIYDSRITKQPTCSKEGERTYTCECGKSFTLVIPETKMHEYVIDEGTFATCTQTGISRGTHCSICNEVLVKQEILPALGHSKTTINFKKATYFESGYSGDIVCSVCNVQIEKGHKTSKLKLNKPSIELSQKGKNIKVSYKKIKDATEYEISIKINNKWKKYNTKRLNYAIKNLKKGIKYSVKVRAIVSENSNIAYSKYSDVKKIKLK